MLRKALFGITIVVISSLLILIEANTETVSLEAVFPTNVTLGSYVYIEGAVEKIFVDTENKIHNIYKGGIFTEVNSDGLCLVRSKVKCQAVEVFYCIQHTYEVTVQVERQGVPTEVLYGVECSKMIPGTMKCPPAVTTADTCKRQDAHCMAASLHLNGYVLMEGPVSGYS